MNHIVIHKLAELEEVINTVKIRNQLIFRNREKLEFPIIIDIATG